METSGSLRKWVLLETRKALLVLVTLGEAFLCCGVCSKESTNCPCRALDALGLWAIPAALSQFYLLRVARESDNSKRMWLPSIVLINEYMLMRLHIWACCKIFLAFRTYEKRDSGLGLPHRQLFADCRKHLDSCFVK